MKMPLFECLSKPSLVAKSNPHAGLMSWKLSEWIPIPQEATIYMRVTETTAQGNLEELADNINEVTSSWGLRR